MAASMRRAVWWFALALFVACVTAPREWRDNTPHALLTGPYVMVTGPGSAIIAFRNVRAGATTVLWSADGKRGQVTPRRDGDLYSAELEGLPRGPVIKYGIDVAGKAVASGMFRAGLAPTDTKVRFAVFGDTRTNHVVHRSVIEAVAVEPVDFFLHTGDMVERGGREDLWITFFEIERPLLERAAIYPAIGNHDLGNRGYYARYFFLNRWAHGKSYYVADWGLVRFVSLDVTIICQQRCAQYEYVRAALEEGAARNQWLILFMHDPPYSSGAHGSNLQLRAVIADLAKRYGVELVVTGHDHDYERTQPIDGTTYIVSGSAGAPIRPIQPQPFTAAARTEPHYVLIDIDRDRLTLRAINLRGEAFDTATIRPTPPGGPVHEDGASAAPASGALPAP